MKAKTWLAIAVMSQLAFSCKKDWADNDVSWHHPINKYPKIAIVSDIHYMHPSLLGPGGAAGKAFQNYLNQDPKLVEYSHVIFRSVIAQLKAERPDILLLPGDITKDGEKIGHQTVAAFLQDMERCGTRVFVIPGNHDINNAKAKKYIGDLDYPVEKTTPADFASIYAGYGYKDALSRDASSLSYVAQLSPAVRLIAIDASKYEEYGPAGDVAAGRIKPQTLTWILAQIADAKKCNMEVFAMMHHNLIEHYAGQSQLDPGYVIDDWQNVAGKLADAGLKIIFTGHYHANDIAYYSTKSNKIFDIETGSLVTAPSPFRMVRVKNNKLEIESKTVQAVDAGLPGGLSFQAYAHMFLSQHLDGYFGYYLTNILGAPAPVAAFATPLFRNGIMAHFAGDEKMPNDQRLKIQELGSMSAQLAGIATTLWTDPGEADNNTTVTY